MLVRWDGATLLLRAARTGSLELAMSAGQSYDRFVGQVTTVPCTGVSTAGAHEAKRRDQVLLIAASQHR